MIRLDVRSPQTPDTLSLTLHEQLRSIPILELPVEAIDDPDLPHDPLHVGMLIVMPTIPTPIETTEEATNVATPEIVPFHPELDLTLLQDTAMPGRLAVIKGVQLRVNQKSCPWTKASLDLSLGGLVKIFGKSKTLPEPAYNSWTVPKSPALRDIAV